MDIKFTEGASCCVVIASGGYPKEYIKGYEMDFSGLFGDDPKAQAAAKFETEDGITVFHAGTKVEFAGGDPVYRTNSGRVLNIVAVAENLEAAIKKAYDAAEKIEFKDMFFRKDIGEKALTQLKSGESHRG